MDINETSPALVEDRLTLTKTRVAAAPWCQNLKDLVYHTIIKNAEFFLRPKCLYPLSVLPKSLRQELLKQVELNFKRNETFVFDKRSINEVLFKKNLAIVETLLSPETKEFELDWLLATCPLEYRPLYTRQILGLLVRLAPNLRSLTIGRKLLSSEMDWYEPEILDDELLAFIMQMLNLTQLHLNKYVFTCSELMDLNKKLPNLTHLACNISLLDIGPDSSALVDSLKHLKVFLFDISYECEPFVKCMFPFIRAELATSILVKSPQMEVVGDYAIAMSFNLAFKPTHEFATPMRLQHLCICLEDPLTEAQWRMLPDITHLKVRDDTTKHVDAYSIETGFELLLQFPKVKHLHVVHDIGAHYLVRLLQRYGENLETLSLMGSLLHDMQLRNISVLCPILKSLKIFGELKSDPVPWEPQDYFQHLKELHLQLHPRPNQVNIFRLLSVPNLEKVTLDEASIDAADMTLLSNLVKTKSIFKKLTSFRYFLSDSPFGINQDQESFTLSSELVKNICAYAPKVADVKFDMYEPYHQSVQSALDPSSSACNFLEKYNDPNLADILSIFKNN